MHEDDPLQQVAGLAYAGSALGAVLAGDMLTLFLYWEGTAIFSVFLIWASRTESAYHAGMRYIIIQVASGVLLLAGALLHYNTTGSLEFTLLGLDGVGIGIGTEMALNGTAAHAFCHILYKALLFMSMGAVLLRAGTVKGSELGGLFKSMPWTTGFCIIGAASISASQYVGCDGDCRSFVHWHRRFPSIPLRASPL